MYFLCTDNTINHHPRGAVDVLILDLFIYFLFPKANTSVYPDCSCAPSTVLENKQYFAAKDEPCVVPGVWGEEVERPGVSLSAPLRLLLLQPAEQSGKTTLEDAGGAQCHGVCSCVHNRLDSTARVWPFVCLFVLWAQLEQLSTNKHRDMQTAEIGLIVDVYWNISGFI